MSVASSKAAVSDDELPGVLVRLDSSALWGVLLGWIGSGWRSSFGTNRVRILGMVVLIGTLTRANSRRARARA